MSIYSKITEQDLIKLSKLAEQQKNQRASKIKNRKLKENHYIKLAESISPITKKLDEVHDSTKKLGEVTEKSRPENTLPHSAIEHTPPRLPIESEQIHPGIIYDTSLENTLSNLQNQKGFF